MSFPVLLCIWCRQRERNEHIGTVPAANAFDALLLLGIFFFLIHAVCPNHNYILKLVPKKCPPPFPLFFTLH